MGVRMPVLLRLLGLLRQYKLRTVIVGISAVLTGVFVLVTPTIVGWAIDSIHLGKGSLAVGELAFAGAAIVVSSALRGLFYYVQQYEGEVLSQQVAYDL